VEIGTELQKFDITDAAIAELGSRYMGLTISGLDDKRGYAAVHAARMDVRARRIKVEKIGKELRADALSYQRAVIAEEKRIIALLAPIESHLETEEDRIDAEKERIKREAEEKETARIQARIDRLYAVGARFDGSTYSILGVSVPQGNVPIMPDADFESCIEAMQKAVDAENARLAEEEAKRKAEEERLARIAAEQEAERKRLEEVARRQEEEAAAERARIAAEQEKIRQEKENIEAEKRAAEEAKRKAEEEERRKAELEKARVEAAEKARREEAERIEREAKEKSEREVAEKAETERQEALRPDKEKLLSLADAIETVKMPEVGADAQAIIDYARQSLVKVADTIRKKTREM
jgi:hypothetical protein